MNDRAIGLSSNGTFVTSESHSTAQNQAGRVVRILTKEGIRVFKYMKAEEAFAIGQVAMIAALIDNADVDATQAIGTSYLKGTGDFVANEFGGGSLATFPSAFVAIDVNTGFGQNRAISSNQGSTDVLFLEKDHGWDVALDLTSDYVTYDPNYVSLCDTDDVSARASIPHGVAISAVTDEYWAWFQVGGYCPLIRCVGTTDPTIRGSIITASSTAGACKGPTAAGTTADDVVSAFGMAHWAYAQADTAGVGVAATLFCRPTLISS